MSTAGPRAGRISHFGATTMLALTSGEIGFYHREGYLLIPGLLSEQQAADLREEVMDLMRAIGGHEGNKLKQSAEYKANTHLDRFINSAPLRGLASELMKGESSLYLPFTAVKGVG